MSQPIYMDHNATTPVDPRVVEAMLPCMTEQFGNAASRTHAYGWAAAKLAEVARERLRPACSPHGADDAAEDHEASPLSGDRYPSRAPESTGGAARGAALPGRAGGRGALMC